jgi:uncharacterized protein (TIGR01777 family)
VLLLLGLRAEGRTVRIFLTGATGFIGRALVPRLGREGHSVVVWARSPARAQGLLGGGVEIVVGDAGSAAVTQALRGCHGAVNLSGEPLIGKRWTTPQRALLEQSRVQFTESLVNAMAANSARPGVLVSASAVGYYGNRGDERLTEASSQGNDFLANLCSHWESAAQLAETKLGARVVIMRMGVVLGRGGGALSRMLPPFRLGLGGPIGSGRQYLPWIHVRDLVTVITTALSDERYRGPLNLVAPQPVTSHDFAKALGGALKRPAVLPIPALGLKAIFGEAAGVLLDSQRVEPHALTTLGFRWEFPTLRSAFEEIVGSGV